MESSLGDKILNHPLTRWLAVIPGAIVAAMLTSLFTNLIAWILGSGGGTWFGFEVTSENPNNEISKGLGYHLMAYVIQPGMIAGVFVYAARVIAPIHKQVVGWLFMSITVLLTVWFCTSLNRVTGGHIGFWNWLSIVSYPVGGIVGARKKLEL